MAVISDSTTPPHSHPAAFSNSTGIPTILNSAMVESRDRAEGGEKSRAEEMLSRAPSRSNNFSVSPQKRQSSNNHQEAPPSTSLVRGIGGPSDGKAGVGVGGRSRDEINAIIWKATARSKYANNQRDKDIMTTDKINSSKERLRATMEAIPRGCAEWKRKEREVDALVSHAGETGSRRGLSE